MVLHAIGDAGCRTARACYAGLSQRAQELLNGQMDIGRDLAQKRGRDIATCVERNGGTAAVGMTELLVRTTLTNLEETVGSK